MKKRLVAFLALASVLAPTAVGFAGCGKKVADNADTLEIFISDFGYGTEWLDDLIVEFKKQDWVQTKYPNVDIPKPSSNSERTFPADKMITNGKTNTFDLLFACDSASAYYGRKDSSGNAFFEDLTSVYNADIPGEDVSFASKMDDGILSNMLHTNKDNEKAYYSVPWVNGYMGLLYNKDLTEKHLGKDYELPKTTIQLEKMAKDLKDKKVTPFISSTKSGYWNQVSYTWWVQYEGTEAYEDYWLGVDKYDEMTSENFKQLGRLRSLETLESLIHKDKGYNHEDVNTLEFTAAQSKYILGEAVMMPNGDWFENEMRANYKEDKNRYDIRFMQMPVLSAIVENTGLYTHDKAYNTLTDAEKAAYDEKLSAIISVIDKNGTLTDAQAAVAELTQADFDKIKEARRIVYGVEDHVAYVPSYATAKDLAKDFLLFMGSDVACETFMKSTNGASTAFKYNVEEKSPTLYQSFSNLQKERAKIAQNGITPFSASTSRLCYLGGLTYYTISSALESFFTSQNEKDRKSAQYIYNNDIEYYINKNNGEYWNELLTRAGIKQN